MDARRKPSVSPLDQVASLLATSRPVSFHQFNHLAAAANAAGHLIQPEGFAARQSDRPHWSRRPSTSPSELNLSQPDQHWPDLSETTHRPELDDERRKGPRSGRVSSIYQMAIHLNRRLSSAESKG